MTELTVRKAGIKDARFVCKLINQYADEGAMLPRALSEFYDNMRDFFVAEHEGRPVGCVALHLVWDDLAEVKSLAIEREMKGKGAGSALVTACLDEAGTFGLKRVFCLTYAREFFLGLGFADISKEELPHKVWAECIKCPKFPDCDEKAMIYTWE